MAVGKLLIVEDGVATGRLIAAILTESGYEVIGPASTNVAAVQLIECCSPDAALLDVRLGSVKSFSIAELLLLLGIPFAFMTGDEMDEIPLHLSGAFLLRKPISLEVLLAAAGVLIGPRSSPA